MLVMEQGDDPGFRDPDNSAAFSELVRNLDYFDASPFIRRARTMLYRTLRPRPGMTIVDVGCGTGLDVAALASRIQPHGTVSASTSAGAC